MAAKKILMFTMEDCPYCRQALRWMDELTRDFPEYAEIEIEKIDETVYPEIADRYDYYYVPTYYVGNEKLHEGIATKEKVQRVFECALKG